jgi:hypothetical protein
VTIGISTTSTVPHPITTAERDAAYRVSFADAREFSKISKFVAACRQQWPGARIVLRADADADEHTKPPGDENPTT